MRVFRTIIKQKDEALSRGRALFSAVDDEAKSARTLAEQLRAQLVVESQAAQEAGQQVASLREMLEKDSIRADLIEQQLKEMKAALAASEAERQDLALALQELELSQRDTAVSVETERLGRQQLAEELVGAKEALAFAQDRVGELADRLAEAKQQAEAQSQELVALGEASSKAQRVDELEAQVAELTERLAAAEAQGADLAGQVAAFQSEHDWSKASIDQSQTRVVTLEQELLELGALRDTAVQEASGFSQQVQTLIAQVASLEEQAHAQEADHRSQLEASLAQVHAQVSGDFEQQLAAERAARTEAEAALAESRGEAQGTQAALAQMQGRVEELTEQLQAATQQAFDADARVHQLRAAGDVTELQASKTAAEQRVVSAEQRSRDLTEKLRAVEAKVAQAESRAAQAEARSKDALSRAASAQAAEGRARLAEARQVEATEQVNSLTQERDSLLSDLAQMQASEIELKQRILDLEGASAPVVAPPAAGPGEAALKAENTTLKRRLMAAETAAESVASLKVKLAKLESQLKGK
jgi:chromosome segregation ATPase